MSDSIGSSIGNPILTPEKLSSARGTGEMTVAGTCRKYAFLILLLFAGAGVTWVPAMKAFDAAGIDFDRVVSVQVGTDEDGDAVYETKYMHGNEVEPKYGPLPPVDLGNVVPMMIGGVFVGFVLAVIIIFVPKVAPALSPFYAFAEGVSIGGISAVAELQFGGIVMQAAALTFSMQAVMLVLYRSGMLKATGPFVMGLTGIMFGYLVLLVADSVMQSFFDSRVGLIHDNSWLGIGFSVGVCIMAALNYIVDFDTIEQGVAEGAPEHMEWYGAFGMVVTTVWLYLEALRLLIKLRSDSKVLWAFFNPRGKSVAPATA